MGSYSTLLPLIVMLIIFYVALIVPESRRKKKFNAMLKALKVNDEIITRGGMFGKIIAIQDNFLTIQTGPDRVKIKITKDAVHIVTTVAEADTTEVK